MRCKFTWSCTTCGARWQLQPVQYIVTELRLTPIIYVVDCKHLVPSGRFVSFVSCQSRKRPNIHWPHKEDREMKPKLWDYVQNVILQTHTHKQTTRSCIICVWVLHSRWLRPQTNNQNIYNIVAFIQNVYLRERALEFHYMYIVRVVSLISHPSSNITLL